MYPVGRGVRLEKMSIALITGGNSGIGRAAATSLARHRAGEIASVIDGGMLLKTAQTR